MNADDELLFLLGLDPSPPAAGDASPGAAAPPAGHDVSPVDGLELDIDFADPLDPLAVAPELAIARYLAAPCAPYAAIPVPDDLRGSRVASLTDRYGRLAAWSAEELGRCGAWQCHGPGGALPGRGGDIVLICLLEPHPTSPVHGFSGVSLATPDFRELVDPEARLLRRMDAGIAPDYDPLHAALARWRPWDRDLEAAP